MRKMLECYVQDTECHVQDTECHVQDAGMSCAACNRSMTMRQSSDNALLDTAFLECTVKASLSAFFPSPTIHPADHLHKQYVNLLRCKMHSTSLLLHLLQVTNDTATEAMANGSSRRLLADQV